MDAEQPSIDQDVRNLAVPLLASGEPLLATVRVSYSGTVPPPTAGGLGGLLDETDTPSVVFPTARQMALALTDRRIVAWALGLTGKPRDHLGEVPLGAITEAYCEQGRRSMSLTLCLSSGAQVSLEALRHEDPVAFAEAVDDQLP